MSNNLDLDQDRHFVGPDLGPNCLQRLSADEKSHKQGKLMFKGDNLKILTFFLQVATVVLVY